MSQRLLFICWTVGFIVWGMFGAVDAAPAASPGADSSASILAQQQAPIVPPVADAQNPVEPVWEPLQIPSQQMPRAESVQPESAVTGVLMFWNSSIEAEGGSPSLDDPLASDRPDFTEASSTVGRGRVQLEMGYTYYHDAVGSVSQTTHSFPEMLWRVGMLADWFEFRIGYNHGGLVTRDPLAGRLSEYGSEDLYLGIKLGLTPQQGFLPEMALVPQMSVPTGDDLFTADRTLPGVNWLYGWDISEFLSFAGSTQCNLGVDEGETFVEFAQSLTVGYTFTEKLGGYTEFFGIMPSGAVEVLPEYYFNGGFIYRLSNNLQLDIRAGVGLNEAAYDQFQGIGFVRRW